MSKYLADHRWVFNTGNDPYITTALTAGLKVDQFARHFDCATGLSGNLVLCVLSEHSVCFAYPRSMKL